MEDLDRETLFANETFVIGMLQAVAGGSIVAALAQADVLIKYAGRLPFFLFLTFIALSLIFAILAAYWKHQYKMWDVKAIASKNNAVRSGIKHDGGNKELEYSIESINRSKKANWYLKSMRLVVFLSVLFIVIGVSELVASFWYQEFCVQALSST
jgi:hypothetical protein